jgi:HTH-type transcriptional regulator, sugar sensing transcriptional regulator
MDTGDLISVLPDAGLSPYQAKAYVTLLEIGSAAASDLATTSGVPGPRIYDILHGLEEDGFIVTYEQDRLYARALPPSEALDSVRTRVSRFQDAIEEIDDRWQQPETDDHEITVVKRFDTVFERTKRDIRAAEHHVLLALMPPQFQALQPTLREAHSRGVQIHAVVHPRPDEAISLETFDLKASCTELYRTIPCRGKPFVALIDHQKASLALNIDTTDEYGFMVDDPLHEYLLWFYLMGLFEAADLVYADEDLRLPITFGEIRSFIRTISPLLSDGKTIVVRVNGRRIETNYPCTLRGEVIGIEYGDESNDGENPSIFQLTAQATFILETPDGSVSVGGKGAVIEDVESNEIVFEAVE